jgi:hypothetical protein
MLKRAVSCNATPSQGLVGRDGGIWTGTQNARHHRAFQEGCTNDQATTLFFTAMLFSTSLIARLVFNRLSGVTLMESMPSSTRN